jgi:hypothetical protein
MKLFFAMLLVVQFLINYTHLVHVYSFNKNKSSCICFKTCFNRLIGSTQETITLFTFYNLVCCYLLFIYFNPIFSNNLNNYQFKSLIIIKIQGFKNCPSWLLHPFRLKNVSILIKSPWLKWHVYFLSNEHD